MVTELDTSIYAYADSLDVLNKGMPLDQKLAAIHEALFAQQRLRLQSLNRHGHAFC